MAAPHGFSDTLRAAKKRARVAAMARRAGCDPALGAALGTILLRERSPPPGIIVGGFWPLQGEIDIRPLLHALVERGHTVALPVTPARGEPLSFRRWEPTAPLTPGRFGTEHPEGPELAPGFLLVPLLAFDRAGRRLGYGGGYYDRTLARLRSACAIGCAFAAQEVDEVPAGPADFRLPAIATERGIITCSTDT